MSAAGEALTKLIQDMEARPSAPLVPAPAEVAINCPECRGAGGFRGTGADREDEVCPACDGLGAVRVDVTKLRRYEPEPGEDS